MKLTRRRLVKTAVCANALFSKASAQTPGGGRPSGGEFPKAAGLTLEVAGFIGKTAYRDVPEDVIDLGKKSILDGLGLALSGSVAETGKLSRAYVKTMGLSRGDSTIIGSSLKAPPRFAAFVNGIGIHADDYDDAGRRSSPRGSAGRALSWRDE